MKDANTLQSHFEAKGKLSSKLAKSGICTHGWIKGTDIYAKCLHCGKTFPSQQSAWEEHGSFF